jgi:outer membrane protein OmpA-like peptidoglycan-associated protein
MTRRRCSTPVGVLRGAAVALAVAVAVPGPSALASPTSPSSAAESSDLTEPQTSSEGVEVRTFGTVQVRPYQKVENPLVTFAVHGVQRIEGGTVVYYSAGSSEAPPDADGLSELVATQLAGRYSGGGALSSVRLVDASAMQVLSTLPLPEGQDTVRGRPFASKTTAVPDETGTMGVLFAVLPELAAGTETVDVQLAFGVTVPDVPVGDGLFEPTLDAGEVIPLGTGWPEIDEQQLQDVDKPELSVHPLAVVTEAIDKSSVTTQEEEQVTIDLAADVLFAFDKADLTPASRAKLAEVGAQITAQASPGRLAIIGHTDSKGTDAYNDDLSRRRAQAVADALSPQVRGVDLDITVEGRGEKEPVAENTTDEGRQANRRVSVTYTIAGG